MGPMFDLFRGGVQQLFDFLMLKPVTSCIVGNWLLPICVRYFYAQARHFVHLGGVMHRRCNFPAWLRAIPED